MNKEKIVSLKTEEGELVCVTSQTATYYVGDTGYILDVVITDDEYITYLYKKDGSIKVRISNEKKSVYLSISEYVKGVMKRVNDASSSFDEVMTLAMVSELAS